MPDVCDIIRHENMEKINKTDGGYTIIICLLHIKTPLRSWRWHAESVLLQFTNDTINTL